MSLVGCCNSLRFLYLYANSFRDQPLAAARACAVQITGMPLHLVVTYHDSTERLTCGVSGGTDCALGVHRVGD